MVVALEHPVGIRHARLRRRCVVVDHVAAEDRDLAERRLLDAVRTRLHELAGDAADLEHRQRGAVGEHGSHLEQDLQALAHGDRRVGGAAVGQPVEVVERLGAVARLEQERPAGGDVGQRGANLARLAGEDERGLGVQAAADLRGVRLVGPLRLLERLAVPPGRRGPGGIIDYGHGSSVGGAASRIHRSAWTVDPG